MTLQDFATTEIVFEEFRIAGPAGGIELYVRNKRPAAMHEFKPETTIVMVHGASFSSGSLYDVSVGGFSFMDYLARAGFDVFAVDVRGYGKSTRPPEMEVDPALAPPTAGTDDGVVDFGATVDYVLDLRGLSQVNVFAMSWGGSVVGAYTAANGDKVRKLSMLAPLWLSEKPIPLDPGGDLGAYRLIPVEKVEARWLSAAPEKSRAALLPGGWFDAWAKVTLAEDPWSTGKEPGMLRAVNGPVQDTRTYWRADNPYYDPADINVPVHLIHGEWDIDVTIDLAFDFFLRLTSTPYKSWVEIGEATHMMLLEKNRLQVFKSIVSFFDEDYAPET